MTDDFAVTKVTSEIIAHLERRREKAARDEESAAREVEAALQPIRAAYLESQLPPAYFEALEQEIRGIVPGAWRAIAGPYSALEERGFGRWRDGDLLARLAYVLMGLTLGGLIVWLPFIPIWERWVPFVTAVGGWWLPDAQVAWHRRRYGRALGRIVERMGRLQPRLESRVGVNDLLPPTRGAS